MNDAFQYVNQKYRYLVKDNYFQIVTGKEEAEFAWIAANHFLGGFDSNNIMGVAEIGGTHAQIAFGVSKPSSDAKKYVESISVNKKKYKVFRNSWNNYGDVDVEKSILQHLKDQNKTESPCHLIGTPDIGKGFGLNTEFTGKPNFDKCIELISTVHQKSSDNKCDSDPCLFMDKNDDNEDVCVPYPGGLSYAVVYGMMSYNLEYMNYSTEVSIDQYLADSYAYGNKTYEQAKALNPTYGYTSKVYFQQCLTVSFLQRGTNGEIKTLRRVNSTRWAGLKLDWPIGAAIYLLLYIEACQFIS